MLRRCTKCLKDLSLDRFAPDKHRMLGRRRVCRSCMNARATALRHGAPKCAPPPLDQRFWSKVNIPLDRNACWEWTASPAQARYGLLKMQSTQVGAHRLAYELVIGTVPEGLCVLHRCDNPRCVNPAHLFLGTGLDNIRDMDAKGRRYVHRGEANGSARLTEENVRGIRVAYVPRRVTYARLAANYGMHRDTIRKIVKRRLWKHVT